MHESERLPGMQDPASLAHHWAAQSQRGFDRFLAFLGNGPVVSQAVGAQ